MTLLDLILTSLIKPCILMLLVWWYLRDNQRQAASHQHLTALAVFLILLLNALAGFEITPNVPEIALKLPLSATTIGLLQTSAASLWQSNIFIAALSLYLGVAIWIIFYVSIGLFVTRSRSAAAKPNARIQNICDQLCRSISCKRTIQIKLHKSISSPQTWGAFKPTILMPPQAPNWSDQHLRLILIHELAHIQRQDWLSRLMARFICAVYWFIPFVWKLENTLLNTSERSCDDWVISRKNDSFEYAQLLTTLSNSKASELVTEEINGGSEHYFRILSLLDSYLDREPISKNNVLVITALVGLLLAPVSFLKFNIETQHNNLQALTRHGLLWQASTDTYTHNKPAVERPVPQSPTPKSNNKPILAHAQPAPSSRRPLEEILVRVNSMAHEDLLPGDINIEIADSALPFSASERVTVSGYLPTRHSIPSYPDEAIRRNINGHVTIEFSLNKQGHPYNLKITKSTPNNIFDQAASHALLNSRFQPYRLNNQYVDVSGISLDYLFQLHPP